MFLTLTLSPWHNMTSSSLGHNFKHEKNKICHSKEQFNTEPAGYACPIHSVCFAGLVFRWMSSPVYMEEIETQLGTRCREIRQILACTKIKVGSTTQGYKPALTGLVCRRAPWLAALEQLGVEVYKARNKQSCVATEKQNLPSAVIATQLLSSWQHSVSIL